MIIRTWEEKDLDRIEEMERACFSDPWKRTDLEGVIKFPFYQSFLAEEGGQVCGYGCMIALFETAEIANIAVDIPFRKRGIGREILQAMHAKAKALGASEALLEVRKSNVAAIALYESMGYSRYGIRENYYGDEDAVLMRKELQ